MSRPKFVLLTAALLLITASLTAQAGPEFQVNSYTSSTQRSPSVAIDPNGNFVVAWNSFNQDGSSDGIFAQRFDNSAIPQGSEFQVNSYTSDIQYSPSVAIDTNGNFVVAWHSNNQDGSNYGIFAQRFDQSANPLGSEFQVNSFTNSAQRDPSVAIDPNGNFVVAWHSDNQDGSNYGIFAAQGGEADLSITKTADPNQVSAGEEITYTITVSNAGPAGASNVIVEDLLAEGLGFLSVAASQGSCSESDGTVTCDLGTIDMAASATVTLVVETLAPGSYENRATATSDQTDADGATGTAPVVTAAGSQIPALDEWALMMMALLLAVAGFVAVRR